MQLNKATYHSLAANRSYMSRSQYQNFLSCEAAAMAKLSGAWVEEPSTALLVGSYVHSWNDQSRREFIAEHPEMFTKKGELKADFKLADQMIATLEKDPFAMFMLSGQKEVVFTAEFAGALWRVMADVYNPERGRMVDLKTTKSIRELHWSDEHRAKVSFIEQYGYMTQAALYSEIERIANGRPEGDWLDFYAVAVSKESVPDKEVIYMGDPERFQQELESIKLHMPRIIMVKEGKVEPIRCERCDFCKSTKQLTGAIHYSSLSA